jgi:hypothetical protein
MLVKSIDQEWQPALESVIEAFMADWRQRNTVVADLICVTLEKCLTYSVSKVLEVILVREDLYAAKGLSRIPSRCSLR